MGGAAFLYQAVPAFRADRRGNFGVVAAAVAGVLTLSAGFALNVAQLSLTRSSLLNALDAAVTSTARDLTTGRIAEKDARGVIEAFLTANGGIGFAAADRIVLDGLTVDKATGAVRAQASVAVDLVFPLFGEPTRRVSTESAALYSSRRIEVALMLDITGSMQGQKLRDLKSAAKNAVTAFLAGQDKTNPRTRVALVPYADAVNTGSLSRVVYAERDGNSNSEPPPLKPKDIVTASASGFPSWMPDYTEVEGSAPPPDLCATDREGTLQFSDAGPGDGMVNRDWRLQFCPSSRLMPLSTDEAALKAAIDGFRASGNTAGQIGIQWSWYMLSPQWGSVLPASARPEPRDDKAVAKYAVLMTDGEFNTGFAGVAAGENPRSQAGKSRRYAERLCAEMKKQGIELFTVGFMLKEQNAKAVMKACASPDSGGSQHYFEASTGAELDDAYQTIARNIERLALTK
jgi:Flp pilus assembly protein TadG